MFDKEQVDKLLAEVAEQIKKLPKAAIQKTDKKITHKGYNTTGYKLEWIWELLIKVFGPSHILLAVQDLYVEETLTDKGYRQFGASLRSMIRIVDGGEVLAEASAFGGHVAHMRGDALKGAETNAKKKALAIWGIGIDVYKGLIDDDDQPLPEGYDRPRERLRSDPVKSEEVSGEKDSQLGQKDGKLIEEFKRLAVLVGEQEDTPEYAYVEFLSYPRDGKILHLGPKSFDSWAFPLSDKRRTWLAGAIDKLLLKFPELEINADDIQF